MVRAMLQNASLPNSLWCYAAETAADVYRYGVKPHVNNLRIWGWSVYVRVPDPKKLDNRVIHGNFLGLLSPALLSVIGILLLPLLNTLMLSDFMSSTLVFIKMINYQLVLFFFLVLPLQI
jgi:hypothetical protein